MGVISSISSWLRPPPPAVAVRAAIERAVVQVDPLLKLVGGYERRLAPAADHALAYCDSLVAEIPGPLDVSLSAYGADALIHALFPAADEIGATLGKSQDLREFMFQPSQQEADIFYALLGMRRREKSVLGMSLQGGLIQADTPQTLLYFADHTLKSPSLDAEATRQRLREDFFDSLVLSFADQLAHRKREYLGLQGKASMLRAQARGARDDGAVGLRELEIVLRDTAAALTPERLLDELHVWLAAPEAHLRMEPVSVTVDLLGVETSAANAPGVHTLNFPEMFSRDRRHWIVLLARIPRVEALAALERQVQAHRYIVI